MSKVYEALRQKQNEISGIQTPTDSFYGEVVNSINLPAVDVDTELIDDSVLRAACNAEVDLPKAEAVSLADSCGPHTEAPRMNASANKFRRLPLDKAETAKLIFLSDPHGLAAEQFRFLRRTLEQKFPHGAILLVTSPAPRDGKTLTSINLSACLGDSRQATLLVEGDIRQPAVKNVLGPSTASAGIEDALTGSSDPANAICLVDNLGFHVSMVQHPPADPASVMNGIGTKQYLEWARKYFHWVVIDSPPVLPAVDVAHLSALADAVLLVVRAESTPRALLTRSFEMLGDRLSGVVMNEAMVESNSYYRYFADYRHKAGTK
jgi:capsular exopolysaccharide synthesis family protein